MSDSMSAPSEMGAIQRHFALWGAACVGIGIMLGRGFPGFFQFFARIEVAHVNLPLCILVWIMIVPMLVRIDFGMLALVKSHWRGIGVTLFASWLVKPFAMTFFASLLMRQLFAAWLPAGQIDGYIAGLILLAAAPCTAMVFVWSRLCKGDPHFTLSQVALNDAFLIYTFAPLVALLFGLASITIPWDTLLTSVGMYIVIPVVLGQLIRKGLVVEGEPMPGRGNTVPGRYSRSALLLFLVLLSACQSGAILQQPFLIPLLAVPILIQIGFSAGLAYLLSKILGVPHSVAGPSTLIGASNFVELAAATAISLFGLRSGAALAAMVGVLVEVPVMLCLVRAVNHSRRWYEGMEGASRTSRAR